MEDTQQAKPPSYELSAFVASNLREISNQALELANQVQAISSEEGLERVLCRQMGEGLLRLSISYRTVVGVLGDWQIQK